MAKMGLLHDYDLMANAEYSAIGNTCAVCGRSPTRYQWSDYHGEAMCCSCGCAYQLKGGTEKEEREAKYPYLNMDEKFIPIAKEYWNLTKLFVHYGQSFSRNDGMPELIEWVKKNHPEFMEEKNKANG